MADLPDYYAVLEVSPSATVDEIRKSFRRLAKVHHPDVNQSNPNAAQVYKALALAYETLSDARLRDRYDQQRAPAAPAAPQNGQRSGNSSPTGASQSSGSPVAPSAGRPVSNRVSTGGSFSDLFSGGGQRPAPSKPGATLFRPAAAPPAAAPPAAPPPTIPTAPSPAPAAPDPRQTEVLRLRQEDLDRRERMLADREASVQSKELDIRMKEVKLSAQTEDLKRMTAELQRRASSPLPSYGVPEDPRRAAELERQAAELERKTAEWERKQADLRSQENDLHVLETQYQSDLVTLEKLRAELKVREARFAALKRENLDIKVQIAALLAEHEGRSRQLDWRESNLKQREEKLFTALSEQAVRMASSNSSE